MRLTLRTKTFVPLGLLSALFLAFLYADWFPRSLRNLEEQELRAAQRHLDSVAEGLIPLLLARELDTVHESLGALLRQRRDWRGLRLVDPGGRTIFPLAGGAEAAPRGADDHVIERPIRFLDLPLGTLTLTLDTAAVTAPARAAQRELALALGVVLCGYLLGIWLVLRTAHRELRRTFRALKRQHAELQRVHAESQRLELELRQAQKLEAVGRLAAGVAHEINTPIQFIGDNTRFLGDAFAGLGAVLATLERAVARLGPPPEVVEEVRRAAEEADLAYLREQVPRTVERTLAGVRRVATIVRAMKEFAHPDQKEMVATDLNRALQATLEVARNEYEHVADVETSFAELPPVVCHAGDVNQVFLNVIVNAAHAVGDAVQGTGKKGRIRVVTALEGAVARVSISDTGAGIPPAVQERIYDPFFTTKEVGRGTGQGLAIARSIVEKHGGTISFDTAPGEGTTFHVRLPLRPAAPEGRPPEGGPPAPGEAPPP